MLGRKYKKTAEHKRKISETMKGRPSNVLGKHINVGDKNPMRRKEMRLKFCGSGNPMFGKRGKEAPNWQGGVSKSLYPLEFNALLKQEIRQRDNYICQLCGRTEREELEELNRVLAVNHIDFNKQNCKKSNLNTLCCKCNVRINRDREYWTAYFQTKTT